MYNVFINMWRCFSWHIKLMQMLVSDVPLAWTNAPLTLSAIRTANAKSIPTSALNAALAQTSVPSTLPRKRKQSKKRGIFPRILDCQETIRPRKIVPGEAPGFATAHTGCM
jgi:membrane-bound lytic murein transglycosylase B